MRILLLSNTPICPYVDGAGLRTYHLLRHLTGRHEVQALQVCPAGCNPRREAVGPPGVGAEWLESVCSRVWSVPKDRAEVKIRFGFLHDFSGLRDVLAQALAQEHDVIWGHSANWPFFLREQELSRTLLDVQDCYDLAYRRRAAMTASLVEWVRIRAKSMLYRRYVRNYLARVRTAVMVNGADADSLGRLLPGRRIEVVSNGVDAHYYARPADRPAPTVPTLVFTGAMGAAHNVDAALFLARRVFPRVRQQVPDCRLEVVGRSPGPRVRELAEFVAGVRIVGGVQDIRPYLWDATLYVAPMVSGTGVKNKILEAWAAGCAVVSSSLGCEALPARQGENILVADRPAEMATQITRVMREPELRCELGRRGRETVERSCRWEIHASRFEALLGEAAAAPQREWRTG